MLDHDAFWKKQSCELAKEMLANSDLFDSLSDKYHFHRDTMTPEELRTYIEMITSLVLS